MIVLFRSLIGLVAASLLLVVSSYAVTNYQDDFLPTTPTANWDSGWRYFWNAPDGWLADQASGDLATGFVGDIDSYELLLKSPTGWTGDGDDAGSNNPPASYLRLTNTGGHPGAQGSGSNLYQRYAIAAYKVAESGMYSIINSSVQRPNLNGDGLELIIYTQSFTRVSPVVVGPGQTISFDRPLGNLEAGRVIYLAIGAGDSANFDGFNLDFEIVREAGLKAAGYRSDFSAESASTGAWSYLWNAPEGWSSASGGGDLKSGLIGLPDGYVALLDVGDYWTPDGNASGTDNQPAGYLKLTSTGGHPGSAVTSSNARKRSAIVAYEVSQAGFYAIENSFLEKSNPLGDGVGVAVFPDISGAIFIGEAPAGGRISFDTSIGYLDAGDSIYVAFDSEATSGYDAFLMDFDVVYYPVASLQEQVDAAITVSASQVKLVPGRYFSKRASRHLRLNDESNFEIIADGVSLICQNNDRAVEINSCTNITLSGLTVDYDPPLFVQGVIESLSPGSIDLRLMEGYPHAPLPGSDSGVVYEPSGDQPMRSGCVTRYFEETNSIQKLEPDLYRLSLKNAISDEAQQGDLFTMRQDSGTPHGIALLDSSQVTVKDVTIHSSPAFGLFSDGGAGGLNFERVRIEPGAAPLLGGHKRLLSSSADGIHIKNSAGNIRISDCDLSYNGDDSIALSSTYLAVLQVDGTNITVATKIPSLLNVGDALAVYLRATTSRADSSLLTVNPSTLTSQQAQDLWTALFPEVNADIVESNVKVITLDDPIVCQPGDFIANLERTNTGFEITGNRISNTRARGMIIKASGVSDGSYAIPGIISNNVIRNSWLPGILISAQPMDWMEADFSHHVDIVGNELDACGLSPNAAGALRVDLVGLDWNASAGHSDLLIKDNVIKNTPGCSLYIRYARQVEITGNVFEDSHYDYWRDTVSNRSVVWLEAVDAVSFTGTNTVRNLNTANADITALIGQGDFVSNLSLGSGLVEQDGEVTPDIVGLTAWRSNYFGAAGVDNSALENTIWGDSADPDGDRLPNLIEYVLALDPTAMDPAVPGLAVGNQFGSMQVDFFKNTDRLSAEADLDLYVLASAKLGDEANWFVLNDQETLLDEVDGFEYLRKTIPTEYDQLFMKLATHRTTPVPEDRVNLLAALEHRELTYKIVDGQWLKMTLFLSTVPVEDSMPVMLFMHGGGWQSGDRWQQFYGTFYETFETLLAQGVACATIEYRLAERDGRTAYDCVVDCKDAARFLVKNAADLGIDPTRMGLWGGSAGGHLSLMTALADESLFPGDPDLVDSVPQFRCIAAYFPATTFLDLDVQAGAVFENPGQYYTVLGGVYADNLEMAGLLSPTEYLTPTSPPILLLHGDADSILSYNNSVYMKDLADAIGADVTLLTVSNGSHGFGNVPITPTLTEINQASANFIIQKLTAP
jgi:acetyl esterase/lipase